MTTHNATAPFPVSVYRHVSDEPLIRPVDRRTRSHHAARLTQTMEAAGLTVEDIAHRMHVLRDINLFVKPADALSQPLHHDRPACSRVEESLAKYVRRALRRTRAYELKMMHGRGAPDSWPTSDALALAEIADAGVSDDDLIPALVEYAQERLAEVAARREKEQEARAREIIQLMRNRDESLEDVLDTTYDWRVLKLVILDLAEDVTK